MKIGILTFVNTINYGALFQAYALSVTLRQMGHDTQIIQYKNKVIERREHGTNCFSIRGILNLLVIGNGFKRKEKKFRAFNALYLKSTSECDTTTIADVCRGFDKIITGSDQVWNLSLTGYDLHYFLDFVTVPEKKVAYAPSFGESVIPKNYVSKIISLLKDFYALSVRESFGASFISNLLGLEVPVVLDPTLLLEKENWEGLINIHPRKKPYILVYLPHKKDVCFSFAKKLQEKTGYKIIYLSISPRIIRGVKTIYDASPQEWLSWIYYADYVITGSFHGTAFSLNFEKQFFYESLGKDSRIDSLASLAGIVSQNIATADIDNVIDYSKVKDKLLRVRNMSLLWLNNAIENKIIRNE